MMSVVLATIIAVASVIASTLLALKRLELFKRAYGRWAAALFLASFLCFWSVYFWDAAVVGNLEDRLTYAADSSLRSFQPVVQWAVQARQRFWAPFLILFAAGLYLMALKGLRDLPPEAVHPRR